MAAISLEPQHWRCLKFVEAASVTVLSTNTVKSSLLLGHRMARNWTCTRPWRRYWSTSKARWAMKIFLAIVVVCLCQDEYALYSLGTYIGNLEIGLSRQGLYEPFQVNRLACVVRHLRQMQQQWAAVRVEECTEFCVKKVYVTCLCDVYVTFVWLSFAFESFRWWHALSILQLPISAIFVYQVMDRKTLEWAEFLQDSMGVLLDMPVTLRFYLLPDLPSFDCLVAVVTDVSSRKPMQGLQYFASFG